MKPVENHERNQIELSAILRENRLDRLTGTADAIREACSARPHFKIDTLGPHRAYQFRREKTAEGGAGR